MTDEELQWFKELPQHTDEHSYFQVVSEPYLQEAYALSEQYDNVKFLGREFDKYNHPAICYDAPDGPKSHEDWQDDLKTTFPGIAIIYVPVLEMGLNWSPDPELKEDPFIDIPPIYLEDLDDPQPGNYA